MPCDLVTVHWMRAWDIIRRTVFCTPIRLDKLFPIVVNLAHVVFRNRHVSVTI